MLAVDQAKRDHLQVGAGLDELDVVFPLRYRLFPKIDIHQRPHPVDGQREETKERLGGSHGMCVVNAYQVNQDLLAFPES